MNLNHHQWKLIYDAVRKQQMNSVVDGVNYKEYGEILNELWELAYSETYFNIELVEELSKNYKT
jgi:hypothetical protein